MQAKQSQMIIQVKNYKVEISEPIKGQGQLESLYQIQIKDKLMTKMLILSFR